MDNLNDFIKNIEGFISQSSSQQIDFFSLYLENERGNDFFSAAQIGECFRFLKLNEYSNIPSYLSKYSKRGKNCKFIKTKSGYHLERNYKESLLLRTKFIPEIIPSKNLIDIQLFVNTRPYLEFFGKQAIVCYDSQAYDASAVMIRKIIEILVIELFEKYKIEDLIKNQAGDYFYLSDLITKLLEQKCWTISRNAKEALKHFKKIGDMSAHNRRFMTKKDDIDKQKLDLRILIEELVILINF